MNELSTRVWLDEKLWDVLRRRAIAEGTTIRDLIPRMVQQGVNPPASAVRIPALPPTPTAVAVAPAPPAVSVEDHRTESGPPVVMVADLYRCGECGAEVRTGGLSNHLGRHIKERQAAQT